MVIKFYQVYNVHTFTCNLCNSGPTFYKLACAICNPRAMFVQIQLVILSRMFADIETYSGEFAFRGDLAGVTLQVIHILQISF